MKNIILAIYDQLTRPGALRNIFVTRNAFGIFSINSHISRKGNKPKVAYPSKSAALKAAKSMSQKHGVHFSIYKCAWCDSWHIGKNRQNKIKPAMENENTNNSWMIIHNPLYEKLKALPIVDLAPVFSNGVRGRTMSASSSNWLLPLVREAGVKTIIDLRTADHTDKFEEKVKAAELEYRHLAIDSNHTDVHDIITSLPSLFEWMDKGDFYIACAMGLHRTDIAIAIYYVFHPSVSYENVPQLPGHRKDGKLRSDDIACRLNSIMHALTPHELERLSLTADYEIEFYRRKKRLFAVNSHFE